MKLTHLRSWRFGAGVVLVAACAASPIIRPAPVNVAWANKRWPEATLASLDAGRTLYIGKCSGCHSLHAPSQVVGDPDPMRFDDMAKQARLAPEERTLIERYLMAAAMRERVASVAPAKPAPSGHATP